MKPAASPKPYNWWEGFLFLPGIESLIGSGFHAGHKNNSLSKHCTYNESMIFAHDGYNLSFDLYSRGIRRLVETISQGLEAAGY